MNDDVLWESVNWREKILTDDSHLQQLKSIVTENTELANTEPLFLGKIYKIRFSEAFGHVFVNQSIHFVYFSI
jgi:hypothetical protein